MTIFCLACDLCWVFRQRSSFFTLWGWCFLTSPQIPATFGAEIISYFKFFKFTVRTFWIWAFHCLLFGDSWASFVQLSPHGSKPHFAFLPDSWILQDGSCFREKNPHDRELLRTKIETELARKKKSRVQTDVELVVTMGMVIIVTILSIVGHT